MNNFLTGSVQIQVQNGQNKSHDAPPCDLMLQSLVMVCLIITVGGKKGNRTEPNQRIIPNGAYGNF